jgi:hypothetical protein
MENGEVFNTDVRGDLVVNDTVENGGHDARQDDFE